MLFRPKIAASVDKIVTVGHLTGIRIGARVGQERREIRIVKVVIECIEVFNAMGSGDLLTTAATVANRGRSDAASLEGSSNTRLSCFATEFRLRRHAKVQRCGRALTLQLKLLGRRVIRLSFLAVLAAQILNC